MSRLILMRHGNTFEEGQIPLQVGLRTDLPLTSFGKKQALKMGQFLTSLEIKPEAIYAGKLLRQVQFAEIIANELGLKVVIEPALNELDYGDWEGLATSEIEKRWPKEYAEWLEGKWQGDIFGESYEGHLAAIESWLDRLRVEGLPVLACTSNGLLRFFKNEKVKTGNYCEIDLLDDSFIVKKWNQSP